MRKWHFILCIALALLGLAGCQTARRPPKDDDGQSWAQEPATPPTNGSIYQTGREVALFENPIARHVGDIVTIVLNEQTAAQKSATTTTTKNTSATLPGMTVLGKPVTIKGNPVLSANINDAAKFDGATSSRSCSMSRQPPRKARLRRRPRTRAPPCPA